MKYEIALVIGNGFDLNLGLETSYSNYLESDIFKEIFSSSNEKSLAWQLFYEFERNKSNNKKWIDLELYLKTFYASNSQFDKKREDFDLLVENISKFLDNRKVPDIEIMRTTYAYKLLKSIKDKNFIILNFNYTKSLKIILQDLNISEEKIKTNIISVHGEIVKKNIIIGVDEGFKQTKETSFVRKASNENFLNTDINEIFDNSENILFFGHSLGETDHSYFDDFFIDRSSQRPKFKKGILLFYFGSEDWYNKTYEISILTNDKFKKLMDYNLLTKFDIKKNEDALSLEKHLTKAPKVKWEVY